MKHIFVIFLLFVFLVIYFKNDIFIFGQEESLNEHPSKIILTDPNLKAEIVTSGLDFPTSMAFLGPSDFVILEKNTGLVKRVVDGNVVSKPLAEIDVSKKDERGLLGVAVSKIKKENNTNNNNNNKNELTHDVFLSYVSCESKGSNCENKVTQYQLDNKNNELVNPKLLLSVPSFPDPAHVGGIITIGPDDNLYVTIGDFHRTVPKESYKTQAQNFEDGELPDGRSGILRITQEGEPVDKEGILGNEYPLNLYYAYGIRNSFGLDFDPVTGLLWDTENGPNHGDEINLVEPGFNSGSSKIWGKWLFDEEGDKLKNPDKNSNEKFVTVTGIPDDLFYFNGKGHYSEPEFIWDKTIAPTGLIFLDSQSLGQEYENDLFVGSADGGRLFHFDLSEDRRELVLEGNISDKVAKNSKDYGNSLFGEGFFLITDLEIGPEDGYLYVVAPFGASQEKSKEPGLGTVYRITPKENSISQSITNSIPEYEM
ncbi:MAG: PQQ-dependent sugar dehydrogenase, partial [Nitrososphaeraceae archaeon]